MHYQVNLDPQAMTVARFRALQCKIEDYKMNPNYSRIVQAWPAKLASPSTIRHRKACHSPLSLLETDTCLVADSRSIGASLEEPFVFCICLSRRASVGINRTGINWRMPPSRLALKDAISPKLETIIPDTGLAPPQPVSHTNSQLRPLILASLPTQIGAVQHRLCTRLPCKGRIAWLTLVWITPVQSLFNLQYARLQVNL